jgi:hypothetical protein
VVVGRARAVDSTTQHHSELADRRAAADRTRTLSAVRNLETIDSELRLLAAVRWSDLVPATLSSFRRQPASHQCVGRRLLRVARHG